MPTSIRIDSWDDWTRVYNDASVWRSLIDAICVREGIGYQEIQPASANTNAVFLLDRAFALKIYSPFWDEFELERTILDELKHEELIPIPELVACGQIADADAVAWDYLITRYCPGRPFSEIARELPVGEAVLIAEQLGRIVGRLHSLDASRFASRGATRTWNDVVATRRAAAVDELIAAGMLDEALKKSLSALLDEAIGADQEEPRVVVHGDLGADHVLCAPSGEGWRIAALIDFGDAKIGAREYEWMAVWNGFCGRDCELARAYLDAYDPGLNGDGQFAQRAVAWTLLHDFGGDELISQWRVHRQPGPIAQMEELQAVLCPDSIFR